MPKARVSKTSYFHQLSQDKQTASLAPLDLALAALPPKERARVIDFCRARYGVPAPATPPVNVERLSDPLTDLAVNLAQSLSLGAQSGVTTIAQAGADLTGLIHNLFDTDLGDKVQPQLPGFGATYKVFTGAALAANQGPQSTLGEGFIGARLGKPREEAGRLQAVISQ